MSADLLSIAESLYDGGWGVEDYEQVIEEYDVLAQKLFKADLISIAAALYDGGWRVEDREQMIEEYDFTEDDANEICEYFKRWEEVN